ncbi:MAG: hypothetical protein LBK05_04470 [Treponema sp.]|jgi:hypothetical protein|nr:hypothetical protein [Treponema sp.]
MNVLCKMKGPLFAPFAAVLLLCACGSSPPPVKPAPAPPPPKPPAPVSVPAVPAPPARDIDKPVRTVPAVKPVWLGDPDSLGTAEETFFMGKSPRKYTAEGDAESAAREDARSRVLRFYGELLQAAAFEKPIAGITELLNRETEIQGYAQAAVQADIPDNGGSRYMEVYRNEKGQEEYMVYLLYSVAAREAGENAERFAGGISRLYSGKLKPQETLTDALVMYDTVLAGLGQNRLHRAIAYHENPGGGKTGLYRYLSGEIDRLVTGLAFEPLPAAAVQKTDALTRSLRVSSKTIENIGSINAAITIYDEKNTLDSFQVPAGPGNSFSLQIPTQKLAPGRYSVKAELLLKEVSNQALQITNTVTGGFVFEVTPVNAVLVFTGEDLTGDEKDVLAERLRKALEANALPVRIVPGHRDEQNRYAILVTVNTGILPPVPPVNDKELAFWDISLAFLNNEKTVQQTERKRVAEPRTDFSRVFPQAADHVQNSGAFFSGINAAVTQ